MEYTNCFGRYSIEIYCLGIVDSLTEEMFELYIPTKQYTVPEEWISEWVEEYCPLKIADIFIDNQPLPEESTVVPEPERGRSFP